MFGTFLDKNKTYYKLEPLLDLKILYCFCFANEQFETCSVNEVLSVRFSSVRCVVGVALQFKGLPQPRPRIIPRLVVEAYVSFVKEKPEKEASQIKALLRQVVKTEVVKNRKESF